VVQADRIPVWVAVTRRITVVQDIDMVAQEAQEALVVQVVLIQPDSPVTRFAIHKQDYSDFVA
jgi:hypothetical protein